MNLVQSVKGDQATFGDVATTVLSMALKEGSQSNRIDVVFDKYQENYIKNNERSVQGGETGHQLQNITGAQIVRQWRTFLSRIANKTSLITLTVSEWRKAQYREKLHDMQLWMTNATESHLMVVWRCLHSSVTRKKLTDAYFFMLLMLLERDIRLW